MKVKVQSTYFSVFLRNYTENKASLDCRIARDIQK